MIAVYCFVSRIYRRVLREVNETHPKLHDYASISVFTLAFSRKRQKLQPVVLLHPVPTELASGLSVLVAIEFGFSGVMISIKSIDLHIDHGRSVRVCIAKRLRIYRIGKTPWLASCLSIPRHVAGRLV